jgi:hypothetical protein
MLNKPKLVLSSGLRNLQGWTTNEKIIVFESDDWGSMRMPSVNAYNSLLKAGIRVDNCPYNRFDSLETETDLTQLFEILRKFSDKNGNHPVITANCIMANPDFEKIAVSGFKEYYYELFTETFKKTSNCKGSFEIWKQGINDGLFYPQFHGREHLNVHRWMNRLIEKSSETRLAFDHRVYGISTNITTEKRKSYLASLDFDDLSEMTQHEAILKEGLDLFEQLFGFRSASFIATNYIWHHQLERLLSNNGVKYIQGTKIQNEPQGKNQPHKRIKHNLGESNKYKQYFLTRNCSFEPTLKTGNNVLADCLDEIAVAFLMNKPAVISTHRLNFIGALIPENRDNNLILLDILLSTIIKKYPDIEFLTSEQLGNKISDYKNTK